jgi:hypothetical protein
MYKIPRDFSLNVISARINIFKSAIHVIPLDVDLYYVSILSLYYCFAVNLREFYFCTYNAHACNCLALCSAK